MPLHVEGAGFHLAAFVVEHEMREPLGEQGGKRTDHFNGQTLTGRRHGTEHQRQFTVDAVGVKDGGGVVDHLSLKIMYLLANDTQRRRNLISFEFTDVTYTRPDDMTLRFTDFVR